jgi:hypothetical protein
MHLCYFAESPWENRFMALNVLKAKIFRLLGLRDERVSFFHLIKHRTRRAQRNVTDFGARREDESGE